MMTSAHARQGSISPRCSQTSKASRHNKVIKPVRREHSHGHVPQSATRTRKRRERSAEAKRAVSERMKNYWADRRRQAAAAASGDPGNVEDETAGG